MPQLEPRLETDFRSVNVNEPPSLTGEPVIREFRNRLCVLCTDGLCVGLVQRDPRSLAVARQSLVEAMANTHAPSGILLVARGEAEVFERDHLRILAGLGITVRYAQTEHLAAEGQKILFEYWQRRRTVRQGIVSSDDAETDNY